MMERSQAELERIRAALQEQKAELEKRINRIHEHARKPLAADSAEQAAELGNVAVVSALESEAVQQVADIDEALKRLDAGLYGTCVTCGEPIGERRLLARPASAQCLACAEAVAR